MNKRESGGGVSRPGAAEHH